MEENELAPIDEDAALAVRALGLLESVHEAALARESKERGLRFDRRVPILIVCDGIRLEESSRTALIVHGLVLLESKPVETVAAAYKKQVFTHLRLTSLRLNFGAALMRDGTFRIASGMP